MDAKAFVRRHYPQSWTRRSEFGSVRGWVVYLHEHDSRGAGSGRTAAAAWDDARRAVERILSRTAGAPAGPEAPAP